MAEILQSMWTIEPNVNLFSQQTTTTDNRLQQQGKSDPYVSFLLRKATQKTFSIVILVTAAYSTISALNYHFEPPLLLSIAMEMLIC